VSIDSPDAPDTEIPYIGPAEQPEPVPAVVAVLEHALREARAGRLIAVGFAGVSRGGHDTHGYTLGGSNIAHLHLAASRLQRSVLGHGSDE